MISMVVNINKERGYTSHDAVAVIRGALRPLHGKVKVGHTGTLDPLATGVLPVCIGDATKKASFYQAEDKEYIAKIRFGISTDTEDITGLITDENSIYPSEKTFAESCESFIGLIKQIPPMYSAVKVNGKRLYKSARQGVVIERPPRECIIREIESLDFFGSGASIRVVCGKGTYIRTLIKDIGERAGVLACMEELTRTRSGDFNISDSLTLGEFKEKYTSTAITIGKFESLHIGHMALIRETCAIAARMNLKPALLSFTPSPSELFNSAYANVFLPGEKKQILRDKIHIIEQPFTAELKDMPPDDFIRDFLIRKYNCKLVVIGRSFRFGKDGAGTAEILVNAAKTYGFEVKIIPDVFLAGETVSTSLIREKIAQNDFSRAAELLGRPFFIGGIVTKGEKIGRLLGYPTINIDIPKNKLTPGDGVYISGCEIDGRVYPAVTNIGGRPSFGDPTRKCETFILDCERNLYGTAVKIYFYSYIRAQIIFPDAHALSEQIKEDVAQARAYSLIN